MESMTNDGRACFAVPGMKLPHKAATWSRSITLVVRLARLYKVCMRFQRRRKYDFSQVCNLDVGKFAQYKAQCSYK